MCCKQICLPQMKKVEITNNDNLINSINRIFIVFLLCFCVEVKKQIIILLRNVFLCSALLINYCTSSEMCFCNDIHVHINYQDCTL